MVIYDGFSKSLKVVPVLLPLFSKHYWAGFNHFKTKPVLREIK